MGAAEEEDEKAANLRDPEWEVFSNPDPNLNSRNFRLRAVEPPKEYRHILEKVVLAERLREVRSLIGFTRIESPGDYTELGDFPQENRVPLGRSKPKWVPTSEVRGEGVFLHFSQRKPSNNGSRKPRPLMVSSLRHTDAGERLVVWNQTMAIPQCDTSYCIRCLIL